MQTRIHKALSVAIFLLTAITGQLSAQHILDNRIDSLQQMIAKAPPDTSKSRLYLGLTYSLFLRYYIRGSKVSDSLAFFQAAAACRALSEKLNDAYGTGVSYLYESLFYHRVQNKPLRDERLAAAFAVLRAANDKSGLSIAYSYKGDEQPAADITTRLRFYDSALQMAREAGDDKRVAAVLKSQADMHQQEGKYALAIGELQSALELLKRSGGEGIYFTTDLLAYVFGMAGKHKESLQYAIATLDYSRKAGDTTFIVTFYQRLAQVFFNLNNFDKSFYYYGRALNSFLPGKPLLVSRLTVSIVTNMTCCLIKQKKYTEAYDFFTRTIKAYNVDNAVLEAEVDRLYLDLYYFMGDHKKAIQYLSKIWQHPTEVDQDLTRQVELYTRAGQLYFELRQYDKAAWYCDSAYTLAVQFKSWPFRMDNSLVAYKLDSVKGDYLSAIRHYREYKSASDSIQKDIADKQAIELAVQYETDQKNNELKFLTNQATFHREAIRQGSILRNIMIAGSALLLLLLFVTFNRYRIKQKANRLLQEKQDEINRQNRVLEKMVLEEKKITGEKDKLLAEKEWLMKEINHRVKNNLQVVMSLLNTQSAYLKDEAALNAIHESRHRVHAISLIHRKLYQGARLQTVIDMPVYIKELAEYMADSMGTGHRICFDLHIDPLVLDVTQAVPVGLIINEAVTNAVKYAFPNSRKGRIDIYMHQLPEGRIVLQITDNGIGLPESFDWQQTGSLGMSLMSGLSMQLDGAFEVLRSGGLTIKVTYNEKKDPYC